MTATEMHIAVNMGVQKIASFQTDTLLPQEIDFELNIAMMRFIKQRYNPTSNRLGKGFEQSQKRIDDLRNLVVSTISSTVSTGGFLQDSIGWYIYNTSTTNIYMERAILPLDYLFLVSVSAEVHYNCVSNISAQLLNVSTTNEYVKISLISPYPGYKLTSIEFYDGSAWINVLNTPLGEELTRDILALTSNYQYGFLPSYNATLDNETPNNTGSQLDPPVDSNHLYLFKSFIPQDPTTGAFIRTVWVLNGSMSTAVYQYEANKVTSTTINRTAPTATKRISQCWFAQTDDIPTIMKDPFNTTSFDYVPYSVKENFIDVFSDNTFVVPRVFIVYIRKPKAISIINNVGCELPEHTHQEIVEMTIKSILEGIESQRYQSQSMENLESE